MPEKSTYLYLMKLILYRHAKPLSCDKTLALGSDVYESADTNEHLQAQPYVTLIYISIFKKKHNF
jgi:hypothetical protein